jgi:hypothetical protein
MRNRRQATFILTIAIICSTLSAVLVRSLGPATPVVQASLASAPTPAGNPQVAKEIADLNTIHRDLLALKQKNHTDSTALATRLGELGSKLDTTNSKLDGITGKLDSANTTLSTGLFSTGSEKYHSRIGYANWMLQLICTYTQEQRQQSQEVCDIGSIPLLFTED